MDYINALLMHTAYGSYCS